MKKWLLLALGLYVVSSAVSFAGFAAMSPRSISLTGGTEDLPVGDVVEVEEIASRLDIDPNEPVDQVCPLNGKPFTQTERDAWEERRPLAVMIENTPDARPQSGLSSADVVFEAVAEGGVTRFMAMYLCGAQRLDTTLAPVRSARTYYVNLAEGFNRPLYVHVGGSNIEGDYNTNALGYLSHIGWSANNDLNQFSIGYPTFVRNYNRLEGREVATEHTMESTTEGLWAVAEERGWTAVDPIDEENWYEVFEPWTFQTETPEIGNTNQISHEFWSGYDTYAVSWEYDAETNTYLRTMGGEPHVDLNNDQQIAASTVVVFLTEEKGPVNEKKHMIYKTVGTGDALVFQNGQVIEAGWARRDTEDMLQFTDEKGNPLEFSPGLIWVSVVDETTEVDYN